MVLGRRLILSLKILILALGIVTVVFGANEATFDAFDKIGSNYWLAYAAIISGAVLIIIMLILLRRHNPIKN